VAQIDSTTLWGQENIAYWNDDMLRSIDIPESAKLFLATVGMPRMIGSLWHFGPSVHQNVNGCFVIGFDDIVPICISYFEGHVISNEGVVGGHIRYINASIGQFASCLNHYGSYGKSAVKVGASEADIAILVAETEKNIRRIDSSAFCDKENWWPLVVEQMKYGLL
jgi:hypothetical protein